MAATPQTSMGLIADDLNDTDREILDVLSDGRATPQLVRKELAARGREVSRQYVSQRLTRLREHEHIENLHGTGVYEIVDDPR